MWCVTTYDSTSPQEYLACGQTVKQEDLGVIHAVYFSGRQLGEPSSLLAGWGRRSGHFPSAAGIAPIRVHGAARPCSGRAASGRGYRCETVHPAALLAPPTAQWIAEETPVAARRLAAIPHWRERAKPVGDWAAEAPFHSCLRPHAWAR